MADNSKINARQLEFARLVATNPAESAIQLAIRAGYSERSAHANAHRLMAHEGIRQAVAEYRQQLGIAAAENARIDPVAVVNRTWQIANLNSHPSASVAALRLLADISGLARQSPELPAAASELLEALGRGLASQASDTPQSQATDAPVFEARIVSS